MEMKELVSGSLEVVQRWHRICDEAKNKEATWVAQLRKQGIKAAHPNDGWVDREALTIHFAYPQFNDGAGIGDLVMLGWPGEKPEKLRLVRLIGTTGTMLKRFTFTDV